MYRVRESSVLHRTPALICALVLVGCGGGGGGGGGGPAPGNLPPAFSSPASANAAENSSGAIYQATAADPDGNALTFSLSGGADRADFAITAAGALSFAQNPDFEVPEDADQNNVYIVQIAVSDGVTSSTLDLSITVTNVGPDNFRVRRIATGYVEPVLVTMGPGNIAGGTNPADPRRVFIVERRGRIHLLDVAAGTSTEFLNMTSATAVIGEGGLVGFAPAPNYGSSGSFYTYATNASGAVEVSRFRSLTGNRLLGAFSTRDVILTYAHPTFDNHYGGWIGFGNDGFLYIATGDGGGGGDPTNNGQNTNSLLGKMLRIHVTAAPSGPDPDDFPADALRDYAIPSGNPFSGGGGAVEVFAYGLRNPFRANFDPLSGHLWIGDVGQNLREEIDLLRPATDAGANFGWRIMEGTLPFNGAAIPGLIPPVLEYLHGSSPIQGDSVTGGLVYRGPVEALRGHYIWADFVSGNIWSIPISRIGVGMTLTGASFIARRLQFTPDQGQINNITSFGTDFDGNLYVTDFDGDVFRLEVQ